MQVNLLGPIEVIGTDGPIALGGPTRTAVLALLALARGRAVSVDTLLEGAWSGDGPASGARALQSVISRLRAALADADADADAGDGDGPTLEASGAGYVLRLPPGALDIERIETLPAADALALWRGPALEEFAALTAFAPERRRLAELRLTLVERHGDAMLTAGQFAEITSAWESHLGPEPLRGKLWSQLLKALAQSGRQADALRAFQRCRDAFADAGLDPPADIVALEKSIAAGDLVATVPTPAPRRGDLTFLFTDVVGSTRRWEDDAVAMAADLATHDAAIASAVATHRGQLLKSKGEGDSTVSVFESAADALAAAAAAQRALEMPVRMAVHAGSAEERDGDFFGPTLNRAARLRATAHAGQVVCSEAVAGLTRSSLPAGFELLDLGSHRLRDLSTPERVFQLTGDGLAVDFPPLLSLSRRNTNLPAQSTTFIGRETELARVQELLGASRLVTLTGAGGSGKTRLSQQAAADALDDFPDGVWLAELAPISDPDIVAKVLAGALGVSTGAEADATGFVVSALEQKSALVILDNCEHVVESAARLATAILSGCPSAKVLATSRERLRVAGETAWPVPVLTLPEGGAGDPASCEAVQLFRDRASEADPAFSLDEHNIKDIVEICRRVDGIPLAIELAAARVRTLPPAELRRQIEAHRDVLSGGDRTALPRHRSLRGTIDWSYSLLSGHEQQVLRRLTVFRGGWTLSSAEAVAASDDVTALDVLDAVEALVDKSLVTLTPVTGRYDMLETVREYAAEQLAAAAETEEWHRRHAAHMTTLTDQCHLRVSTDQRQALAIALGESDNLNAALTWAADHDLDVLAQIVGDMWELWSVTDERQGSFTWFRKVAACADDLPSSAARALIGAGVMLAFAGDAVTGLALADRGMAAARELGAINDVAEGLTIAGSALLVYERRDEALDYTEAALALVESVDDPLVVALIQSWASQVLYETGQLERAAALITEAYQSMLAMGDNFVRQTIVSTIPHIAPDLMSEDEAQAIQAELDASLGWEATSTTLLAEAGIRALQNGDVDQALAKLEAAVAQPQVNFRSDLAWQATLALTYHAVGRIDDAWELLAPVLAPDSLSPTSDQMLHRTFAVAIRRDQGELVEARQHLDTVLAWLVAGEAPERGWQTFSPRAWSGVLLTLAVTLGNVDAADAARLLAVADALVGNLELLVLGAENERIRREVLPTLPPPPAEAHDIDATASIADAVTYALGNQRPG